MAETFAGRYVLADPIGRGGAGAVWRAWDRRRRRYVAAKVLHRRDAHTLLRFVREQALRIDHPHVLAPRSWAADDEQVLFTMDLARGGSVERLVGDYGPLPPAYVCVLLDQLLAGLGAVHAEGVVHRDVKPANLLLEATGTGPPHLWLSDFGIAVHRDEPRLTEPDHVVGTPGWIAPEQLLGAEPDVPADLYAAGLVAIHLLTGGRPDAQGLVAAYARGVPPAPRDVPAPLWEVLGPLLHPDPQHRFRTATAVRKALAEAARLLPEPTADEEPIEVFDQLGPPPPGFTERGPLPRPFDPEVPYERSTPPYAGGTTPPSSASLPHAAPTTTVARPVPPPPAHPPVPGPVPRRAEPAARPRPGGGPPAKVAVPVLLLALLCFAVGFWALTQAP
ncbi:protein kinase domain-containing protein [Streptomyces sp. CH6]|uniref:serine/threonine-protein kinase n=1 Tax=Streptomyces sp. CH6 TaxID=3420320 RepID=UPI003CFD8F93